MNSSAAKILFHQSHNEAFSHFLKFVQVDLDFFSSIIKNQTLILMNLTFFSLLGGFITPIVGRKLFMFFFWVFSSLAG